MESQVGHGQGALTGKRPGSPQDAHAQQARNLRPSLRQPCPPLLETLTTLSTLIFPFALTVMSPNFTKSLTFASRTSYLPVFPNGLSSQCIPSAENTASCI